jgi:hypothetical protein
MLLRFAGGLVQALDFLHLALFITFSAQLIDALAFLECALFLGPDALLVAHQPRVP